MGGAATLIYTPMLNGQSKLPLFIHSILPNPSTKDKMLGPKGVHYSQVNSEFCVAKINTDTSFFFLPHQNVYLCCDESHIYSLISVYIQREHFFQPLASYFDLYIQSYSIK